MVGPLDGSGQAGANDGEVAVYFHHHNGLIPKDFPDGSGGISEMDGFHKIYLFGFFIVGSLSNVNQSIPYMPRRFSQIVLEHSIYKKWL